MCQAKTLDLILKAAGAIGGFEQQWGWQRGIYAGEYHRGAVLLLHLRKWSRKHPRES